MSTGVLQSLCPDERRGLQFMINSMYREAGRIRKSRDSEWLHLILLCGSCGALQRVLEPE